MVPCQLQQGQEHGHHLQFTSWVILSISLINGEIAITILNKVLFQYWNYSIVVCHPSTRNLQGK